MKNYLKQYRHHITIYGMTILLLLFTAYKYMQSDNNPPIEEKITSIFSLDDIVFKPYLWGYYLTPKIEDKEYLKGDRLHPLQIGGVTFFLLKSYMDNKDENIRKLAKDYLDFLAYSYPYKEESKNSIIFKYNFPIKNFEKGWWSGMTNSSIALSFLAGYEIFHDEKYLQLAKKSMNGVILPINGGGSSLELEESNANWYFEYAKDSMTIENGKFVLNGFLYSLLAVKIFDKYFQEPFYRDAYYHGLNALRKMNNKFYFSDKDWTFYSLNPLVIESTHYAIYENNLYDALYSLTKEDFYLSEITKRRKILKDNYPVNICSDSVNNKYILFSTIGSPNPYWIDTYPIKIDISSKDNKHINTVEIKQTRNSTLPIIDRGFLLFPYEDNYNKLSIYSLKNNDLIKLYDYLIDTTQIFQLSDKPYAADFKINSKFDAIIQNDSLSIIPSRMANLEDSSHYTNVQGVFQLVPNTPIKYKEYKIIGITINPSLALKSFKINFSDASGNVASRYYIPILPNKKNLVLLDWKGLNNSDHLDGTIAKIDIVVYTSKFKDDDNMEVKIDDLLLFRNNVELYHYFNNNDFHFPELFLDD